MSSDVALLVVQPATGAVILELWLGGNLTAERAKATLQRPPDHQAIGWESWGRLTAHEITYLVDGTYAGSIQPSDLKQHLAAFPVDTHWWILCHDY